MTTNTLSTWQFFSLIPNQSNWRDIHVFIQTNSSNQTGEMQHLGAESAKLLCSLKTKLSCSDTCVHCRTRHWHLSAAVPPPQSCVWRPCWWRGDLHWWPVSQSLGSIITLGDQNWRPHDDQQHFLAQTHPFLSCCGPMAWPTFSRRLGVAGIGVSKPPSMPNHLPTSYSSSPLA